jgi:hypothetical protein
MKTLYRDDDWYKKKKDVDVVVKVDGVVDEEGRDGETKAVTRGEASCPVQPCCVCGRGMMLFSERDGFAAKTRESKEMRRRNYSSSSIRATRRGRGRDGLYGCRCRL